MKQHLISAIFYLLFPLSMTGQRYVTTTGETQFFSETPVENIHAVSKKSQAIFNLSTGEIAVRIPIRDFEFPNKLMQEHFNENYMESEKYPVATFSGKLISIPDLNAKGPFPVTVRGKLTIHGVTTDRELQGTLSIKEEGLTITSDFKVALTDHEIEVPKLVFVKIAQIIQVKAEYTLLLRK